MSGTKKKRTEAVDSDDEIEASMPAVTSKPKKREEKQSVEEKGRVIGEANVHVSVTDIYEGVKDRLIRAPYQKKSDTECSKCKGNGTIVDDCLHCRGTGLVLTSSYDEVSCPICEGKKVIGLSCTECTAEHTFQFNCPKGCKTGTRIRCKIIKGANENDYIIGVVQMANETLSRAKNETDVILTTRVPLKLLMMGDYTLTVVGADGKTFAHRYNSKEHRGETHIVIKGKGLPKITTEEYGDLHVIITPVLPPASWFDKEKIKMLDTLFA